MKIAIVNFHRFKTQYVLVLGLLWILAAPINIQEVATYVCQSIISCTEFD